MTNEALERRVSRLENETVAIYDEIKDFKAQTLHRFDSVDSRLDSVDSRLDSVDSRLDTVEAGVVEILRRTPEPT